MVGRGRIDDGDVRLPELSIPRQLRSYSDTRCSGTDDDDPVVRLGWNRRKGPRSGGGGSIPNPG